MFGFSFEIWAQFVAVLGQREVLLALSGVTFLIVTSLAGRWYAERRWARI